MIRDCRMSQGLVVGGVGNKGGGRREMRVKIRDDREKQTTKIKPELMNLGMC